MGIEKYTKGNLLQQFAEKVRGKLVLIWGPSLSGKTTFSLNASRYFNKVLYFRIDKNVTEQQIKEINPNTVVEDINSYDELINRLKSEDVKSYDLIIIDSITGLNETLLEKYRPPRVYNEIAYSQNVVMYLLSRMKPNTTSFVITHARLSDFENKTTEPSLNNRVLKYIDVSYRIMRDREGNVVVKKWFDRNPIKTDNYNIEL